MFKTASFPDPRPPAMPMVDPNDIVVMLPLRTVSEANHSGKLKEKMKRKREQRMVARGLLLPFKHRLRLPATVRLVRIAPGSGLDPGDNLPMSMKAVRDGVADMFDVDDRDPRYNWQYGQQRSQGYWVLVHISFPKSEQPV